MNDRRRRLTHRAIPLVAIATTAFASGAIVGARGGPDARETAERFARAWTRQDFAAMHSELTDGTRQRFPLEALKGIYEQSYAVATTVTVRTLRPRRPVRLAGRDIVRIPVAIATRAFGRIRADLELPLEEGRVAWQEHLVFPGLQPGEELARDVSTPPRAAILARDGTPLAQGPPGKRGSPLGEAARHVAGRLGQPEPDQAPALARAGFPAGAQIGVSGLEKAFNERLAGRAGGRLLAVPEGSAGNAEAPGARVLASTRPRRAASVRTTIDPELQQVAVASLAGRFGGIAVLDARDGSVRALAGVAYSAPQPPGSTFKIVTAAAALESKTAKPETVFPVERAANVGGRSIENAHDEACGGSLLQSFARSCNSVFAPLGVRIGSGPLIETAERFGFNAEPQLFNKRATAAVRPARSTIPEEIASELDLGVTAIGQGRVLATPLQLASVAQTVATGGIRHPTPIVSERELAPAAEPVRAISARTAGQLRTMMVATVASGTGIRAALSGVQIAGKTGTAELGPKAREGAIEGEIEELETDAWFAAFAPARRPRIALAVMFIKANGDGGEIAAPVARQLIAAALQR